MCIKYINKVLQKLTQKDAFVLFFYSVNAKIKVSVKAFTDCYEVTLVLNFEEYLKLGFTFWKQRVPKCNKT